MKSSQQDKLHIPLSDTEFNLALLGITNTHPSLPSLSLSLLTSVILIISSHEIILYNLLVKQF